MIPRSLLARPATPDDEPFLRALFDSVRAGDFAGLEGSGAIAGTLLRLQYDARAADYRRRHPDARQEILVIDGEPAGALWIDRRGPAAWRLLDVALLPVFRGRGLGAQALGTVLDEAGVAGRAVELTVAGGNPARRLYERLGFVVTGGDEVSLSMRREPDVRPTPPASDTLSAPTSPMEIES